MPGDGTAQPRTAWTGSVHLSASCWSRLWACVCAADGCIGEADRPIVEGLLAAIIDCALRDAVYRRCGITDPAPAAVVAAYRAWRRSGVLDQLSRVLGIRLDVDDLFHAPWNAPHQRRCRRVSEPETRNDPVLRHRPPPCSSRRSGSPSTA
jgi:hypothetical protein